MRRIAAVVLLSLFTVLPGTAATAMPRSERLEPPPDFSLVDFGFMGLLLVIVLLMFGIATTTLVWMLYAWRTPEGLRRTRFEVPDQKPKLSFSLLVPARHEEGVLEHTLERLAALDHPLFEVLAIIGHDDPGTRAVAERVAERHPDRVRVVIDHSWPKNKPKALNTALVECRGEVTGVFDAEDEVSPKLLRHIDACFVRTGADVVQGGVQLMNFQSSWFSLRNVLEYYFWFRSRLHFQAEQRFIPLGGNTVFVRTELLREVDGWDPECLSEDCDLGVRLSVRGARTVVAYDPELSTREETPDTVKSLVKQRTRWHQGFLQVLRKGDWRSLRSFRGRMLAFYTLAMPFYQAVFFLFLPVSLAMILFVKLPTLVAMLTFLPLAPTLVMVVAEMVGLREFCRSYGLRPRVWDYTRLVLGTIPYQILLAFSALRAVAREFRGNRSWEKTEHVGAHRVAEPVTAGAASYDSGRAQSGTGR